MWNGDSGCTDHSLGASDRSLCLDRARTVALDAGADAASVTATAGRRGDHQWVGRSERKGRVKLAVLRHGPRRFSVVMPGHPSADLRVLHVNIRYRDGVLTPYEPYDDEWGSGTEPESVQPRRLRSAHPYRSDR